MGTGSLANTGLVDVEDASHTTGSLTGSLTGEHAAEVENQMQDDDSAWAWNTEQDKDIQSQLVADVEDASRTTGSLTGSLANPAASPAASQNRWTGRALLACFSTSTSVQHKPLSFCCLIGRMFRSNEAFQI